jgi:transaldolase
MKPGHPGSSTSSSLLRSQARVQPTLERGVDEAHRLLQQLAAVGVDYKDVVETLETEGIERFTDSFSKLLTGLEAKRQALAPLRWKN